MNTKEIQQWLGWLDDTFGLEFDYGGEIETARLFGKPVAIHRDGEIYKVVGQFAHGSYLLFKEWRYHNE